MFTRKATWDLWRRYVDTQYFMYLVFDSAHVQNDIRVLSVKNVCMADY